jgi:hypothetical protein
MTKKLNAKSDLCSATRCWNLILWICYILTGFISNFCLAFWRNNKTPIKKGKVIPIQAVEALRVARGWGFHIFWHSANRWRQGCQPYAPDAFYPEEVSWYSFLLRGWVDPRAIVRLEGLGKLKKSISSGDLPACSIVPQPTMLLREQ